MIKADKTKAGTIKQAILTKPRKVLSIADEEKLSDEYRQQVISYKTDKKAIEAKLKAGEKVAGAELVDSDYGLRIK